MADWMINALKWSGVGLGIFAVFVLGFYIYVRHKDKKFKKMIDKHKGHFGDQEY